MRAVCLASIIVLWVKCSACQVCHSLVFSDDAFMGYVPKRNTSAVYLGIITNLALELGLQRLEVKPTLGAKHS